MIRYPLWAACLALCCAGVALAEPAPDHPGEEAVKPYAMSNANAGARPMADQATFKAFHGKDGVQRVANSMIDRASTDPRTADIFKAHDLVRVKRTLGELFCYLLGGPCDYSGRDLKTAHKDLGVQNADFNAVVEDLQWAMDKERVPFRAQNKLLAKLAPMQRSVVER